MMVVASLSQRVAARQKSLGHQPPAGILIAGLGMLAAHLGYREVKRAS
jgi:hypothetical protein